MKEFVTGSCHCSLVSVKIQFPTEFCDHCHCHSCRKAHAAAVVTATAVPMSQFLVVKGIELIKKYRSKSGHIRCFCQNCGTSLYSYYVDESNDCSGTVGRTYIPISILDGQLDRKPEAHVSFEEHVDWFNFADNLPKYKAKTEEQLES